MRRDGVRRRRPGRVTVDTEHAGEQAVPQVPLAQGGRVDQVAGPRRKVGDTRQHRPADGADAAARARDDLLGQERVPLAERHDVLEERCLGLRPEDVGDLHPDLLGAEPAELEVVGVGAAHQLGEEALQVGRRWLVVGASGDQDQELAPGHDPDEVVDQVPARAVGPVDVLEHQPQQTVRGQPLHERRERVEHLGAVPTLQRGHRGIEAAGMLLAYEVTQQVRGDTERDRPAHREPATGGHQIGRPPQRPHSLLDQPGLADARLAVDDQQAWLPLPGQGDALPQ